MVTGKCLTVHPVAARLSHCHNPKATLNHFKSKTILQYIHNGNAKLMPSFDPILHDCFTVSVKLGEGIDQVSLHSFPVAVRSPTYRSRAFSHTKSIHTGVCLAKSLPKSPVAHPPHIYFLFQHQNIHSTIQVTNGRTILLERGGNGTVYFPSSHFRPR